MAAAARPAVRELEVSTPDLHRPRIADFCCYELNLMIELDGGVHRLREERDAARDADLRRRRFTVLRFGNDPVLRNPNVVLDAIRDHAAKG